MSFIDTTQNGHILEIKAEGIRSFIERRDAVFTGR